MARYVVALDYSRCVFEAHKLFIVLGSVCSICLCQHVGLISFFLLVAANENGLARTNPLLWF